MLKTFTITLSLICITGCGASVSTDSHAESTDQTTNNNPSVLSNSDNSGNLSTAETSTALPENPRTEIIAPIPAPVLIPPPTSSISEPKPTHAPTKISVGMKVADALTVPGAKQTVSAIMTGGKITGTIVIQWNNKSYYTNVDFAQEGGFAYGTRYDSPEDVEAFIEIACSDMAHPSDFTDQAIVTEQIK